MLRRERDKWTSHTDATRASAPRPQDPKATAEGLFPDWLNVRSVYRQRPSLTTYYELLYYSQEKFELDCELIFFVAPDSRSARRVVRTSNERLRRGALDCCTRGHHDGVIRFTRGVAPDPDVGARSSHKRLRFRSTNSMTHYSQFVSLTGQPSFSLAVPLPARGKAFLRY
jgi:hypothetical protein